MSLPDHAGDKGQQSIAAEFKDAGDTKNSTGSEVKAEQPKSEAIQSPQNQQSDSQTPEAIRKDRPQLNHPLPLTPSGDDIKHQTFNAQLAKDREIARKNPVRIKPEQKLNDKESGLMVKKDDVRSGKKGVLKQEFSKEDDGLGM